MECTRCIEQQYVRVICVALMMKNFCFNTSCMVNP